MKKDNGIFHQETNYHRSRLGVCSTVLFLVFMLPVIYYQLKSLGIELGITSYFVLFDKEIQGIEFIKSDETIYQRTNL